VAAREDLVGMAFGVNPGDAIDLITASQNQVVLEYTHSYGFEQPAAGRFADEQCSRFGKHATWVNSVRQNLDRSFAIFKCE
jgi:hypothetical protein